MGKLFKDFIGSIPKTIDKTFFSQKSSGRERAAIDLLIHSTPWIVGIACSMGGVYGLPTYLGVDFAFAARKNLQKNKMLNDIQKDWYTMVGQKIIEEDAYKKLYNANLGKISDANSLVSVWKSIYDK